MIYHDSDYEPDYRVVFSDPMIGTYVLYQGRLLRRRTSVQQREYDEDRKRTALNDAESFLDHHFDRMNIEIGDLVECSHVHATHGQGDVAQVILLDISRTNFVDVLLTEGDTLNRISASTIKNLIKKETRSIEELLTSDEEFDRNIGKARVAYQNLRQKIRKMSKGQRIKKFISRWANPIYETHASTGMEGILYDQGYNDGYQAALKDLSRKEYYD